MHFFLQFMFMLVLSLKLNAQEIFIPKQFEEGQIIEQIILISDVDGVVREGVEATADPRVIQAIKSLLENQGVDVTFISGTPIENDLTLEPWRRGNVPLSKVFGFSFKQELLQERVAIYGVLGGHCMKADGTMKVVDEYSPEISYELGKLLIHSFLEEVLHYGSHEQKAVAKHLQIELASLESDHSDHSPNVTAAGFYKIIRVIHEHLDSNFRLITNGALVETHTSNPPWGSTLSSKWLKEEINQPQHMIFNLPQSQKQIATGYAKKAGEGFNYLLISKTNKGLTTKKHIEEKIKQFPKALIVTIGDTQVDFPMHQNAHLAFHVGLKEVWLNNKLPHCVMICNSEGKDAQHIEGTLQVLKFLNEAVGKPFFDLKYIPRCNSSGQWDYYSIREIQSLES
jgi:hypothetical protein